jgi:hypothetical protein
LPDVFDHKNQNGIPDRAVVGLGGIAAVLAASGSLGVLVEAASLSFLFTFAVVCGPAFRERQGLRLITGFGAVAAAGACLALVVRLSRTDPMALAFLIVLVFSTLLGRKVLLRHTS